MSVFVNKRQLAALRHFFPGDLPPDVILLPDSLMLFQSVQIRSGTIARMGVPSSWGSVRTGIERGWRR